MAGSYTTLHSPALRNNQARSGVEFKLFLSLTITLLHVVFDFGAPLPTPFRIGARIAACRFARTIS
jgi:hypothetical protein